MTLKELEGRLRQGLLNGHLVLEGELFGSEFVARTFEAVFGQPKLIFNEATISAADGTVSVAGLSTVLGLEALQATATFRRIDGAAAMTLTAQMPLDQAMIVPGALWLPVWGVDLFVDLSADAVSGGLRGSVRAGMLEVPVVLPVPAPPGMWIMRGDFDQLPLERLSDLGLLTGGDEVTGLAPAIISGLAELRLSGFEMAIHPATMSLAYMSLAVSPSQGLDIIAGKLALEKIALLLFIEAPQDPIRRSSWLGLRATVRIGELDIPFRVMGGGAALFLEADFSGVPLPGITTIARWIGGDGLADSLPGALSALDGLTIPRLAFSVDTAAKTLGSLGLSLKSSKDWNIIPGKLAVGGIEIDLDVRQPLAKTRTAAGEIRGWLAIGNSKLPVRATKWWDGGWSLGLNTGAKPALPKLSEMAAALGVDGLEDSLPEGLNTLGGVTLTAFNVDFTPGSKSPSRISLGLAAKGPWKIPGWDAGVEDLYLRLKVDTPAAKSRSVTGEIGGTFRLGGVAFALSATKVSAQDAWTIAAMPADGMALNLTAAVRDLLPGVTLPDELPNVTLTNLSLSLTPARGAFVFRARAAGNWDIPIGVSGLTVRSITLEVSRAEGKTGGALGGEFAVGGASFKCEYRVPGEFALAATVPSLSLSGLLQDLTGGSDIRNLPVPASVLAAELRDVTITVRPADRTFAIAARSDLGDVELMVRKANSGWGFAAGFVPAKTWRLSNLSRELAVLDGLDFSGTSLVLSSAAGPDAPPLTMLHGRTASIVRGFNILAHINVEPLGVKNIIGVGFLDVHAAVGTSLADLLLEARFAAAVQISDNVAFGDITFRLKPTPKDFYVGLFGVVTAKLGESALRFTGGMQVTPQGASFQATMQGKWDEPFGAKGVMIANVALDLGMSFAPPLPMIGIAGTLQVGEFEGLVAVKFDAGSPNKSMLAVAFNRLTLIDILKSFIDKSVLDAGGGFLKTALNVGFEDVNIYIVPQTTRIGELTFEPGFTVKGTLLLWGLRAYAYLNIDQANGIEAHGEVDTINLLDGAFQLKGAKGKPKASIDLLFKRGKEAKFQMNGAIVLLGLSSETVIEFSGDGFYFKTTGKIFDLFEASLEAWGKDFGKGGDFYIRASMRNDLFKYLREEATKAIRSSAQSAIGKIADAQKEVAKAQRDVDSLNRSIDDMRRTVQQERDRDAGRLRDAQRAMTGAQNEVNRLNRLIDAMRRTVQQERDRDNGRLRDAQKAVTNAQNTVNGIQGDIDSAKRWIDMRNREINDWRRWFDNSQWYEKSYRWTQLSWEVSWRSSDIAAQYTKIGSLETAKWTAIGVLEGAKQVLRGFQLAATTIPVDADPRVAALFVARDSANAALEGVKLTLKGFELAATNIPVDADPRIAGLFVARETATAALKATELVLEGAKITVGAMAEVAVAVTKAALGGIVDIRAASFEAGLSAVKGGRVGLSISVSFLEGAPQTMSLSFDFQDPLNAALSLAQKLFPLPAQ